MRIKAQVAAFLLSVSVTGAFSADIQRDPDGRIHRSASARNEFKRIQPCPATGKPSGKCPGYIIDHVTPLCAGGQDMPANMQWQTVAEAKSKDIGERRQCADNRSQRK